ncbi:MAG: gluconolaconase, partial [Ilumatobacteraceae bacterium]|nr:gluconolaconase [Ilumatobacteraceae bacterium]
FVCATIDASAIESDEGTRDEGAAVHEPRVVMDGLAFGESPRWHDERLWFSDWGAGEVIALDVEGRSEVVTRVDGFPFCIDFLPDGRLLIVSPQRRLLRMEPDGSSVTHADLADLAATAWNDITVDGRGNAYVNNVGFTFPGGDFRPGIVAVVHPDGAARQVADGVAFPNGMVVTADNTTLIVAESYGHRLTAFDIAADGDLSNRRMWADLGEAAAPDGICIDADGAVWYADVPNQCCVRVREGGDVLERIDLDRGGFACALGGASGAQLFIVATAWHGSAGIDFTQRTGQVLVVDVAVPAAPRPVAPN